MAPQTSPVGDSSRPSSSQLIIALFLAKSKPSVLSAQGYVSSLQKCMKRGCRLEDQPSTNNHVDTLAFWRDGFEKSENAQNELRAKVFELEKRLGNQNELRAKIVELEERLLEMRTEQKSGTPVSHRKRKKSLDNAECSSTTASKRLRPADSTFSVGDGFLVAIADDVKHLSDQKGIFIHHLYLLEQLAAQRNIETERLVTIACQVTYDISQVILSIEYTQASDSLRPTTSRREKTVKERDIEEIRLRSEVELNAKLKITAFAFSRLLGILNRIDVLKEWPLVRGKVIYGCVEIFRDLLQHICTLSVAQADEKPARSYSYNLRISPTRNGGRPELPSEQTTVTTEKSGNIWKLCNLLLSLASNLNTKRSSDKEIMEGILYFLFSHVGSILKIFVFEDSYPDDFLGVPSSSNQITAIHPDYELNLRNAKAQAAYLIHLLNGLIPFTGEASRNASHPSSSTPATPPLGIAQQKLAKISSSALQDTLMHFVFGDSVDPGDFPGTLTPPTPPQGNPRPDIADTQGEEESVEDWFKSEVWRIVGWDVLKNYIAL